MNYEEVLLKTQHELQKSSVPIVLWGAGIMGEMALKALSYLGKNPVCFCDANKELHGTDMLGLPVLSVEEAIDKYASSIIVLCVGMLGYSYQREEAAVSLAKKLKYTGTIIQGDVIHYVYSTKILKRAISSANYADTLYALRHSDNVLQHLDIVITDRCTLNCRDCGMLIPYKKPGKDADIDEIMLAVEKLFSVVDGIRWVQIHGGEPFLHQQLTEVAKRVAKIDKALFVVAITNATLAPNQEDYNELALYTSCFLLSDYGTSHSRYKDEIYDACKKSGMICVKNNYNPDGRAWHTFGSISNQNYTIEEKKDTFSNCMKMECTCRISPDGVFHFCERQLLPSIRTMEENEKEIIHLEDPEVCGEVLKEKWEYIRHLPYLIACGYCGGGTDVPAAVQAKGRLDYEDMDE